MATLTDHLYRQGTPRPKIPQKIVIEELCSLLGIHQTQLRYETSFLSLGGHSLSAVRLASSCKKRGVHLFIDQILSGKSILELLQTAIISAESIQQVETRKTSTGGNEWLDLLDATGDDFRIESRCNFPCRTKYIPRNGHGRKSDYGLRKHASGFSTLVPATNMQLELIHGSVKNAGTNIIRHFQTYLPQHIPVMREAWRAVFEMEPLLGVRFSEDLRQHQNSQFDWTEVSAENPARFHELVCEYPQKPTVASSWKVVTLTDSDSSINKVKSVIIWTIHHALIDGYSAELVFAKVRRVAAGKPISPGPSFAEFNYSLKQLQKERKEEGDAFWGGQQELYSKAEGIFQLPPPMDPPHGTGEFVIKTDLSTERLEYIARECNVTPATIYHTAWALIMSLFADSDTIVFGTVLSGRDLPFAGIEETIGPVVNTLPLIVFLNPEFTLRNLLTHISERMRALAKYQWTTPENGYSRHFQSALAMQVDINPQEEDLFSPIERPYCKQMTDLPLSVSVERDQICLQYSQNTFRSKDIELMAKLYSMATTLFMHLDNSISSCQDRLMTVDIHRTLLANGNCSSPMTLASSVTDDLVTLFERIVKMHPDTVAVEKGVHLIKYEQLGIAADSVSRHLQTFISPGEIICVDADRTINWIVAIFGILKAGAVYCPLDPALPLELRTTMFKQSGAKIFLAPCAVGVERAPLAGQLTLVIKDILDDIMTGTPYLPRAIPMPSAAAYVCFTSGSTGTPKGTICSHEGLVAFQRDLEVRLFAEPGVKVSQFMSVAFDGSIHEIFSALCYGGTLVLPPGDNLFDTLTKADSAILTPSVAEILDPDDFVGLKNIYLVGEQVKQSVADRWTGKKAVYNMYGPTEGTCGATIKRLFPGGSVTIGGPNRSTRVYILNSKKKLIPPGMIGELYLAGVQVARGYLDLPEITADRFLPDTICPELGGFMYRTGDRGYWNEEGEIVCLGRRDRQIKLRGFRLDMDDLETRVARAVTGLTSVAIVPKNDFLVAAIQPSTLDPDLVNAAIAKTLPVYARPRHTIFVDQFPTTRAGKLDYKEIISDKFINGQSDMRGLQTATETDIASAWRHILKLDDLVYIGPESNFFDLGGNSLLQMTLSARLTSALKFKVPLKVIIASQSLHDLALEVDKLKDMERSPPFQSSAIGPESISAIEYDWCKKYWLNLGTSAFTVSFVARFSPKEVDIAALSQVCDVVLARHSILRSRYVACGDSGVKRKYAEHAPRAQKVKHMDIWTEVNRPFDLTNSSPIRILLSRDTFAIIMSHIIADLTTLKIILQEIQALYSGKTLDVVKHTYEESAILKNEVAALDLQFWTNYLGDLPKTGVEKGHLFPRKSYGGTSNFFEIPQGTSESLTNFVFKNGVSYQQLVLAAVALALQPDEEDMDIILGSPFINRSTEADLQTVGLFLEPLPVRVRCSSIKDITPESYLQDVRKSAKAALSHAVPWSRLLEHLGLPSDYPNNPLFDVMVTFHHSTSAPALSIPGFSPCLTWSEGSKFSLMVEFITLKTGKLLMRMEYDTDQYSSQKISSIAGSIAEALSSLTEGLPLTMMKKPAEHTIIPPKELNCLFGLALDEI
ncbi:nonribosomal peptide synthase GliP-like protein [Delitschia confertaspora ATCC 74209]|uniref:Nonribosomal peptide synthase GliP-like protein n=1 Tax=Delitschia confertaspora ATCC 74209 TaxID=1513339 RepID=A0A9P4MSL8_9PLEO|nr:nonribosomal peptide synthase GliP-like protein [Delitschia confertaspora ATCC 74209]